MTRYIDLHSIQSNEMIQQLQDTEVYTASWSRIDSSWQPAYKYMCEIMEQEGVKTDGNPPIWAWAETEDDDIPQIARELLSEMDWKKGISVVYLQVPFEQVLLSSYFHWNMLLDESLETGQIVVNDDLFSLERLDGDDYIQAVIPCIRSEWVHYVYPLKKF